MRMGLLVLVLALAGCGNAAADAEWQFSHARTQSEKCEAASKASEAYLAQRDEANQRLWRSMAVITCMNAGI